MARAGHLGSTGSASKGSRNGAQAPRAPLGVPATVSLAVETLVLLPVAVVGLSVMEATGDAAFGHGPAGRTVLLASLGVVTAVPLLLFGAAASRIPLSLLGLLQYLTPTLQLLCGVVVLHEGLPPERLYFNIGRVGNTSSASIPLAIHDAVQEGVIDRPRRVFAPGFGAGAVGGYVVMRVDPAVVAR